MVSPVFNGGFTYFPSPFKLKSCALIVLRAMGKEKMVQQEKTCFNISTKTALDCPAKAALFSSLCDDWISQPAL